MLKNISVSKKLYLLAGTLLAVLLLVAGISISGTNKTTNGFSDLLENEVVMSDLTSQIDSLMLQCRRSEKDFLMRRDLKYFDKVEGNIEKLKEKAGQLQSLALSSGFTEEAAMAASIAEHAEKYVTSFKKVVDCWEVKGLDHESGLQGEFRGIAGELSEVLLEHQVGDINIAMLQCRRYEKDYQSTRSDKYQQKLTGALDEYQSILESKPISNELLGEALARYRKTCEEFIASSVDDANDEQLYQQVRGDAGVLQELLKTVYVADASAMLLEIRKQEKDYLLRGDKKYVEKTQAAVAKLVKAFEDAPIADEYKQDTAEKCGAYLTAFMKLVEKDYETVEAISQMRDAVHQIEPEVEQIHENIKTIVAGKQEETNADAAQSMVFALSISGVGLIIGCVLSWVIARGLTRPIALMVEMLKDIAEGEGDLTKRVDADRKDELGEMGKWFNTFVEKIHDIIVEVSGNATDVASASTEIAASSEEMASGMNEQTKQVDQIAAAIEEMSASVVEVAKKSSDASDNATKSGKVANEGGEVVSQTVEGMQAINEAVNASSDSVTELGKRGEEIGKIIEVINDIADQTNLLALNAAIEAARAGDAGRGFAVVADEVRKLADRTTKATDEVGESIEAIQSETKLAVERMATGTQEVEKGVELATQAGESLKQIVISTGDVSDLIGSIAAAAEQQSAASEQVSVNIEKISAVSKEATEGAEQASRASSQLSTKAESLQEMVSRFKVSA